MTSHDMSSASHRKPGSIWGRWYMVLLYVVAVPLLLLIVTVAVYDRYYEREWQALSETLRSEGVPLTVDELNAMLPADLPSDNICTYIRNLRERHPIDDKSEEGVLILDSDLRDLYGGLPRKAIAKTQQFIADNQTLYDELRQLRSRQPGSCYSAEEANDGMNHIFPTGDASHACELLTAQHTVALIEKNSRLAYDCLELMFIAKKGHDYLYGILAPLLDAFTMQLIVNAIELQLRAETVTREQLEQWLQQMRDMDIQPRMKDRWKKDAPWYIILRTEEIRTGNLYIYEGAEDFQAHKIPRVVSKRRLVRYGRQLQAFIKASDSPLASMQTAKRFDQQNDTDFIQTKLFSILADEETSYTKATTTLILRAASYRAALTGVACEMYRLDKGAWPSSLSQLVPDYLDQIPLDPYTEKPLQMVQRDGGLVIYAVGEDFTDNGGDVDNKLDVGFRLVSPGKRGLVIIDE